MGPDQLSWLPKQADAIAAMLRWCEGDLVRLFAELRALAADEWLARQPIHLWADRLGTSKGPAGRPASPPPPKDLPTW